MRTAKLGAPRRGFRWARLREDAIRWVTRRHRADGFEATVTRDRVYILPTRQGYLLLATIVVMLVGSINYANNMAFLLTFLIVGIGHNAMWYTHRNLLGLQVRVLPVAPAFAGDAQVLRLRLEETAGRPREALRLQQGQREGSPVHVEAGGTTTIEVALEPRPRGRHGLARQRLFSGHPLGLLVAWTWLTLDTEVLVYPRPIAAGSPLPMAPASTTDGTVTAPAAVPEPDLDGIRAYRPGDAPNRIVWKAVARSGRLLVRETGGGGGPPVWLDWAQVIGPDPEFRLSVLCQAVLTAAAGERPFGLRLPGVELPPAAGPEHRERCLRALALFEAPTS